MAAAALLPRTLGELQLYRILQRANLLSYFDAFIQQGGDDVRQLCEAGEDEFLEIMALVGMASKPLHVRRLQKALRDWVTNPGLFHQPLASLPVSSIPVYQLPEGAPAAAAAAAWLGLPCAPAAAGGSYDRGAGGSGAREPHVKVPKCAAATCVQSAPGPGKPDGAAAAGAPGAGEARLCWSGPPGGGGGAGGGGGGAESEPSLSPAAELGSPASPKEQGGGGGGGGEALDAAAALSVAECVERLAASLPRSGPGAVRELLRGNRKLARSVGHIFGMSDADPRKEDEIRKYSAIYGRFDSKRKDGKHLTLHELTVNEAAAQLCVKDNALLTRRDELFALARQISREVTYKYTYRTTKSKCGERDELSPKRIKVEDGLPDFQDSLQTLCQQAKAKSEELAALGSQPEKGVTKQMEFLCAQAGLERLQQAERRLAAGLYRQSSEEHSPNGLASDGSDGQGERPLNLRIPNLQNRQPHHFVVDGELSRLYPSETKSHSSENLGILKDYPHSAFPLEKKVIKTEPEDSR